MSGVSTEEFERLNQDLIALKAQLYETKEREQNALHKQQVAEQEVILFKKQDTNGIKMKTGLKGIFGNKQVQVETEDLRPQLEELKTQNDALKQNVKHMFAENQSLQEQITHLKERLGDERSSFEKTAEDERNALAASRLADLADQIETMKRNEAESANKITLLDAELLHTKHQLTQAEDMLQKAKEELKEASHSFGNSSTSTAGHASSEEDSLSTRLMQSVQKKDEALRLLREDMDVLVVKLREKEMEIMKERENASVVLSMQKQIKEQEAKLKKMSLDVNKTAKVSAIQDQMKKITEGLTETNEKLESEKKSIEAQLIEKEDSLTQARSLLNTSQAVCEEQKKKVVVLSMDLEKSQTLYQQLAQSSKEEKHDLEAQIKRAKEDFEHARTSWKSQEASLSEELSACQSERDFIKASLIATQNLLSESQIIVKSNSTKVDALAKEKTELLSKLSEVEGAFEESKVNHSIESKKRNRLVEELRSQLKKDAIRVRELEANVAETKDALTTAESSFRRNSSGMGGELVPSEMLQAYENSRKSSGGSEVEQEVTAALSVRLEQSQTENYALRQKTKYLEQNISLLNEDIIAKKSVIQFLSRRIEPGVLGTPQTNPEAKKLFQSQSPAVQQELFDKMEVALQQACLLNLEIKDNLRKMGAEGTRLLDVIDELDKEKRQMEEELHTIRETYQELKDGQELNEMAKQDAERLLNNSEAQFKLESSALTNRIAEANLNLKLVQMERDRLSAELAQLQENTAITSLQEQVSTPAFGLQFCPSSESATKNSIDALTTVASVADTTNTTLATAIATSTSEMNSFLSTADGLSSKEHTALTMRSQGESKLPVLQTFVELLSPPVSQIIPESLIREDVSSSSHVETHLSPLLQTSSSDESKPRDSVVTRLTDILNADLTLPSTKSNLPLNEAANGELDIKKEQADDDEIEIIPSVSASVTVDDQSAAFANSRKSELINPKEAEQIWAETRSESFSTSQENVESETLALQEPVEIASIESIDANETPNGLHIIPSELAPSLVEVSLTPDTLSTIDLLVDQRNQLESKAESFKLENEITDSKADNDEPDHELTGAHPVSSENGAENLTMHIRL